MNNKYFTDDWPEMPDSGNSGPKEGLFKRIVMIGAPIFVCGLLFLGLVHFGFFKKDNKVNDNNGTDSHSLKENEDVGDRQIVSDDVKETLDGYCELIDEKGSYVSSKMNDVNVYEMCSNYQCITTRNEDGVIVYYFKDCKANSSQYKKVTKEEFDVTSMMDDACDSLDDKGSYTNIDLETNSSIICQNYVCNLTYNGKEYRQSCLG